MHVFGSTCLKAFDRSAGLRADAPHLRSVCLRADAPHLRSAGLRAI